MNSCTVRRLAISVGLLLFGALPSFAAQRVAPVAGKPEAAASAPPTVDRKATGKVQPVDINSAPKAELMKLPGVSDADAQRIIAGRPYLSKAQLVTRSVLSETAYLGIKGRIMARQKGVPVPKAAKGR